MRCPKCGFENREGAQFCLKCGEKLALRCFECGNLLPLSAKFCDRCGYGSELPAYSAQGPGLKRGAASPVPPAGSRQEPEISPKTKTFVFVGVFYAVLLIYLSVSSFYPEGPLHRMGGISHNFWASFAFLGTVLVVISFFLYTVICFSIKKLCALKWTRPKVGEILVGDGYITKQQLKEALAEQENRIGEVLVQGGRITREQLQDALNHKRKVPARLGETLKALGYAKEEDINWALGKLHRKLGEILQEKGLLTEYDLDWILGQQQYGSRRI
ncbi:MAG: zinc-ribbon domain-containing protein [Deltaproteobacteria bacterium]|nr:zinc-ribbon domain-containing protein [Deltaproteobacteria bacterium]MBW1979195.1 zinc-ribbon domain-containing protein [Deltaproteobacteria bacterium]MBW2044425.1 zinc-ribbon domain-containing protein [Deltaproteobacteria bacterium]MBW2300593.1 zinc-ribbon domain-containing protein [Deltaproteobacteria bacterium]